MEATSLVGTWRLVDAISDGEPAFGDNPAGMLVYTNDGHVAVVISHAGRQPLSVADRIEAPAEERAGAFELVRELRVDGDRLVLRTPPTLVGGAERETQLVWTRCR